MLKQSLILVMATLSLAACATTNPGPEGSGEHKQGYLLGRSDAVKQQYWIVQNFQKQPKAAPTKVVSFAITLPTQTNNGVVTVPHTETVRLEQ